MLDVLVEAGARSKYPQSVFFRGFSAGPSRAYPARMSWVRPLFRLAPMAALLLSGASAAQAEPASSSLEVTISGIKSSKGVIRLAICPPATGFPDCKDKAVRTASLPIENGTARITFPGLSDGTYAVSVFHDANANGKLDTFVGIPKEGYGFSRNPPFRPRAPRWDEAWIEVKGTAASAIKIRYVL